MTRLSSLRPRVLLRCGAVGTPGLTGTVAGAPVPAGSQDPRPQHGSRGWYRSRRDGVRAVLVFGTPWPNGPLGRPSSPLAMRSWKVWSCYGFDNKALQLRDGPWPGSGGVILLQGQVWVWKFRALEPTGDSFPPRDREGRGGGGGGSAQGSWEVGRVVN